MNKTEATADIFWTTFNRLNREDQQAVLQRILKDSDLRRDLMELALIEERHVEPVRPLHEYLQDTAR